MDPLIDNPEEDLITGDPNRDHITENPQENLIVENPQNDSSTVDPKKNSITKYSGTKTSLDHRQQSFLVDQWLILFFFGNSRYFVTFYFLIKR